jgi:transposase
VLPATASQLSPVACVRVEDFPWAEAWARVTKDLSNAVAVLARELSWQGTARQYGLDWKSVATIVKRAVDYGLRHRARPPVHVIIGIDEVSQRKGQVYLTAVYDLERRVLLWAGEDRTEEAVKKFFTAEMGRRRCHTLQVVCMDMWAPYASTRSMRSATNCGTVSYLCVPLPRGSIPGSRGTSASRSRVFRQ